MKFAEIFKRMSGVRRGDVQWERQPLTRWLSAGQKMAMIGGMNGIGRALTRLFAANGAEAVVVGRTFRDQGLERLRFIHANLSEMKQAQRVVQELSAESWDMLLFTSGERTRQGGTCGKLRRHRNRRRH